MAARRQQQQQQHLEYAEDSYSDEDEEVVMEMEPERRRGRPRRVSLTTTGSPPDGSFATTMSVSSGSGSNSANSGLATAGGSSLGGAGTQQRRRGRGPSKRPCLNRNALMARENRQRKKAYIEKIEQKLELYQKENLELKNTIEKLKNDLKKSANKEAYLASVLNNKTSITLLLKALNDSLARMHGDRGDATAVKNLAKSGQDGVRWNDSVQSNTAKTNIQSAPFSGCPVKDNTEANQQDNRRINFGQIGVSPPKIARKTMPLINSMLPKIEEPSSVESLMEEDEAKFEQKSSPESHSYCEYNMDMNMVGHNNQQPTTPMSTVSNSMDKGEASLSDTDFSHLSSFNVDLFDNFGKLDDMPDALQFVQDAPDMFNEDTLFDMLDKNSSFLNTDANLNNDTNLLELNKISDTLSEKTLFNTLENTGVCLHINSTRVSLEYCSICYENSLNTEII